MGTSAQLGKGGRRGQQNRKEAPCKTVSLSGQYAGPMIVTVSVCVTTNSRRRGVESEEVHMRARGEQESLSCSRRIHSATRQLCINVQL